MAIEIEQPFGDDANDLPIEDYILNLEATLLDMLPGNTHRADDAAYCSDGAAKGGGAANTLGHVVSGKPVTDEAVLLAGAKVTVGSPSRIRAVETWTERVEYEYEDEAPQRAQQPAAAGEQELVPQQHPIGEPPSTGAEQAHGPRRVSRRRLAHTMRPLEERDDPQTLMSDMRGDEAAAMPNAITGGSTEASFCA
jgi:hypothetical protein